MYVAALIVCYTVCISIHLTSSLLLQGVDIQNFTTSWANGLAMCALLNYFLPEKIPYDTLDPSDKRGNWGLAFKVAG